MCGIVGLFLKNPALEADLGRHLRTMLIGMTDRGPDSAGFAIYHRPVAPGQVKLTCYHPDAYDWSGLAEQLGKAFGARADAEVRANHAVIKVAAAADAVRGWLAQHHPEVRVMSYGQLIEVYKDVGLPAEVADRFGLGEVEGSHAVGHTRMATESAVTTEHSHPFSTGPDLCLVHNGSLSNHNSLRRWLRRRGLDFGTDNDTEVAARYFAHRLAKGASVDEALEAGLHDLDGFFTFIMSTRDGFAVLRDGIACKPAVLAETDDWVAMASEYRSLANLPGVEHAEIWEPKPKVVYSWSLERERQASAA